MLIYVIAVVTSGILTFILGMLYGKRKVVNDVVTTAKVVTSLKATIEIYKLTYKEREEHLNHRISDLMHRIMELIEEKKILEDEIKNTNELNNTK